ncbi:hypothetical protein V6Z11_A05G393400 [Gossypium hirsutum]
MLILTFLLRLFFNIFFPRPINKGLKVSFGDFFLNILGKFSTLKLSLQLSFYNHNNHHSYHLSHRYCAHHHCLPLYLFFQSLLQSSSLPSAHHFSFF